MPSLEIFHSIPEILSYFFPGFVSISIFLFLSSNKLEYSHINVYSICISYAIKVLIDSILYKFNLIRTTGLIYVIYLCFGVVSGCLVYCIYRNPKIKKALSKIANKSQNNNIWNDIIDHKFGTSLILYPSFNNDSYIVGTLVEYEENGTESWFALQDYFVYENGNKRASSDDYSHPAIIAVQLSHVDHVEVLYPRENSEIAMTYNLQTSSKATE